MIAIRKSQMHRSPKFAACICSAAIVVGSLIAASFSHAADPATPTTQPATKTFRLADGSEIPIEQYGETYETLEWRPPIDPKKAKVIADYNYDSGFGTTSIALDLTNKRVYWFLGGGRHGTLMRANLDGSGRKMLLNGLMTPDGEKEIEGARQLNVVPELKKIFWRCQSRSPDPRGVSIYEADLDGKNPKSIIKGLHSCTCLFVDPVSKKLYYNDDGRVLRSNLDGTSEEELGAKAHSLFAIDFKRKLVLAEDGFGISKQSIDGSGREILFECKGIPSLGLSIFFDDARNELYWIANGSSIVRGPIEDLNHYEELIYTGVYRPPFAVGGERIYWINTNGNMLSAALPPTRSLVTKQAPPLIYGFAQLEAAFGDEITVKGSGLSQARRLFWIGAPNGKFIEGKILSAGNEFVTAKVPDLGSDCDRVHIVVSGEGGTTVTLSHDVTPVNNYLQLTRSRADNGFAFLVADQVLLQKAENKLLFLPKGSQGGVGVRGGNVFFVKNGGAALLPTFTGTSPSVVFFEPHGRVTGRGDSSVLIPTPAIRVSYVEQLPTIKK